MQSISKVEILTFRVNFMLRKFNKNSFESVLTKLILSGIHHNLSYFYPGEGFNLIYGVFYFNLDK